MCCCIFNVTVLILPGAAFRRQHATAVYIFDVSMGKFVMSLGVLGVFIIASQIPFAVFGKPVETNEFILLLCRRSVLAPRVPFFSYEPVFADKFPCMLECAPIEGDGIAVFLRPLSFLVRSYSKICRLSLTIANVGDPRNRYIRRCARASTRNGGVAERSSFEAKKRRVVMKKAMTTLVVGVAVAFGAAAIPTTADARWHRGFPIAPVVGGLAAGALVGAALAAPRPYYWREPVYYAPACRIRTDRIWDGWGWRVRRVEDCY
jgi:hypothetical protein